jgi:ERCC4-related helicase
LYFKEKQEAERKRAQGIADYKEYFYGLTQKQLQYESIKAQKELAASPNTKSFLWMVRIMLQ